MATKLFLDAGHGGYDSGAIGNDIAEKNIVLDLALRIERLLKQYKNVEIKLSRQSDEFLTLRDRVELANNWNADCFISLHCNAHTSSSAKGYETFIYNGKVSSETIAFQNVLHQEIMRKIGDSVTDRGKKRANFHVLRESKMKAILTENLFVSNASDAKELKSDEFLDKLAQAHTLGLEKFFGLERTIRPPTNSDELYQVIAGTYNSLSNARSQVAKLEADGYNAYIIKK